MSGPAAEVPDGLPLSEAKAQFSLAYVQMLVAAARMSIKKHTTDYDGVDITIAASAEYELYYAPEFELQLKATSQQHLLKDDHLVWRMEAKPFAKLTHPKRYIPAYLGVLLLPEGPWLSQDERGLFSGSRLYVQRAADLGVIEDDRATKTVHLPRSNLLDVPGLHGIMKSIGEGGDL
ncbi:DUF4365 domain-containing protein [Herbidospora sp. NBRC 101105]|uniref:DUF4365 domain-containing protein n=1 Tax=Herbidospora sp. NBRC 101105 TaxID=3032195 RepID=UPI0024A0760F|nr:DUF4365 domain-containing protein [Herbidospora sp. NBRC 101105]GLX96479.1 hypothetical protein Hesp01_44290 [Herbidospora sp. NBRC 101105]